MQKKERTLLVVLLVGILLAGSVYLYGGKPGGGDQVQEVVNRSVQEQSSMQEKDMTQGQVKVHVKGEVHQPGVYALPEDSRVIDAVQAAGGAKGGADVDKLNLAARLEDGMEVVVLSQGESTTVVQQAADARINLNTASAEELDRLPGIGSTRAQAIVEYRQEHGRFLAVDDLKQVPGIGPKMLDQIRDKVTVN
jgi:competence protein ComEA